MNADALSELHQHSGTRSIIVIRVSRFIEMGEQAPPEGNLPMDSDSDLAYQILLRGIDQGFDNVILKLSEVSSQLDTIPTRISDILSSHPVGPEPINGVSKTNIGTK